MQLLDVINERRAVRNFTARPMERPVIERLINAAIQAPSAMNLQPWAFAALLDPRKIDDCAARAKQYMLGNFGETGLEPSARSLLDKPEFDIFYHAPGLVLVMATSSSSQATEDCCLAAQNLMLAARDEGIGTCWIGFGRPWLNLPATKHEFGLPESYQIVAPLVLGYPEAWPEPHGRRSPEIHWLGQTG